MLKLTKAANTLAQRHGLQLDVNLEDGNVLIFVQGEEENIIEYMFNEDRDQLTFKFQVYGNKIEDLPAHIDNTKLFNRVIKYIGSQLETL
jgi:acylphosphatase